MMKNFTRIGIGVMIFKDDRVLMGKRLGSHGEGQYSFAGGHMEYMESFEDCARREVLEETGIEIKNIRFLMVANVKQYDLKHYVHLTLLADWKNGDPEVLEPNKCEEWLWFDLDNLPEPMFDMCIKSFEAYKNGQCYFDGL